MVSEIERLRRQRWTAVEIAANLQARAQPVARIVQRLGLARLAALEPPPAVVRYERQRPGDLVHLDVKKLGRIGRVGHRITGDRRRRVRGIGWEYVHVAVDDASRVAYVEVLPDEQGATVAAFAAGAGVVSSARYPGARRDDRQRVRLSRAGLRGALPVAGPAARAFVRHAAHNGKAERFIRTMLAQWAYGWPYASSRARVAALPAGCTTTIGIALT